MSDPTHVQVRKWLEKRINGSEQAIDNKWTVELPTDDERFMVIDTPKMPFKIIVNIEEDVSYIAFVTNLQLNELPIEQGGPVFRDLLIKNKLMNLSKFCLTPEDNTLILRCDLYTRYMNKREFNMALESVIVGGRWLIAELGQTEDENRFAKEISALVAAELLKGTSKEEIIEKMIKAGVPEAEVEGMVTEIAIDLGLEKAPKREKEKVEQDYDEAVNRYIW